LADQALPSLELQVLQRGMPNLRCSHVPLISQTSLQTIEADTGAG